MTEDPRAAAILQLPRPYATALRLRDEGLSTERMAEVLGVEPEAVRPLLVVAEAKLASVMNTGPSPQM